MRVAVLDTDACFENDFFKGKQYEIYRMNPSGSITLSDEFPFSHAEYVCAGIWLHNPSAEINVYNIIGDNKKQGGLLRDSLYGILTEGKADIINISAGVEIDYPKELYEICNMRKDIPIVAAHSNNGKEAYPASFNNVIGVKAVSIRGAQFLRYDKESKNVLIDEKAFLSFKHLGQEHLMRGNSMFSAVLTGILSRCIEQKCDVDAFLSEMQNSVLNDKPDTSENMGLKTLILTNRKDDPTWNCFCKSCFNDYDVLEIDDINNCFKSNNYGFMFIDIDDYALFQKKKNCLLDFIRLNKKSIGKFFIRYPFFSYFERKKMIEYEGILIEQLFI